MREEPQATRSPPEEVTVSHGPPKVGMPKPKIGTVEANVDWDTDDVQDRSRSPHPSAGIDAITLGESVGDTPPTEQDTRLVTDRVVEPGAVLPQENVPEVEEKSPDEAPSDDQQMNFLRAISLICMQVQKNYEVFYDIRDEIIKRSTRRNHKVFYDIRDEIISC